MMDMLPYRRTRLHLACLDHNATVVAKLLIDGLEDINARDAWRWTPAHYAARNAQPQVLMLLCAVGADLRARDQNDYAPIDAAVAISGERRIETLRVLLSNGVRLSTVDETYRHHITPEVEKLERSALRCRSATVALLRVKRVGNLWRWDKFLLREVAIAIWTTRYSQEW